MLLTSTKHDIISPVGAVPLVVIFHHNLQLSYHTTGWFLTNFICWYYLDTFDRNHLKFKDAQTTLRLGVENVYPDGFLIDLT